MNEIQSGIKNLGTSELAGIVKSRTEEASEANKTLKAANQEASQESLLNFVSEDASEAAGAWKRAERLKEKSLEKRGPEISKQRKVDKKPEPLQAIKDSADKFQGRNPRMTPRDVLALKERTKGKSKSEILKILNEFRIENQLDPNLENDILKFLEENADPADVESIKAAHQEIELQRKTEEGLASLEETDKTSESKSGVGGTLRDLYQDVVTNHRDPNTLFFELSEKYPSSDELGKAIKYLFKSLGRDLKKDSERPELQSLVAETRSLQSILGIYRFFEGRVGNDGEDKLLRKMFKQIEKGHTPPS